MKHRLISLLLLCALCASLLLPASAASFGRSRYDYADLEFTQDATFSDSFVAYNNFILREGVHLSFTRYAAVEIYGDLILEPGASITAVDDTAFISIGHEGSVQGLDLYYRCRYADGSEKVRKLPPLADVYAQSDVWAQMNPEFRFDTASGLWILAGAVQIGSIPESEEALYAANDITLSGTQTFTSGLDNYYRNFTVAPGADITLNIDTRDIRITGKLTIPEDAVIRGFTTLALTRDAEYDAPLYLLVDGQPEPLTYSVAELLDFGMGDEVISFRYDAELGGWCTKDSLHSADGRAEYGSDPHSEAAMDFAQTRAEQLCQLNLFRGTGTLPDGSPDFDLDRPGTRLEAVVMLIRLLGAEEEALSGTWQHPFTDVPDWADSYVGYAYEAGLTKGMSATEFGTGDTTAQQFLTFLLRALGYTDSDTWENAFALAQGCGVYEDSDLTFLPPRLSFDPFWRADMVILARRALDSDGNRDRLLAADLVARGVFTQEAWESVH